MKHAMLIHHDFERMFDMLTDEECGKLLKAVLRYDKYDEETEFEEVLVCPIE